MASGDGAGMPYIGARISLISNSQIRYEGILYTIDPREATVALQNVRCFGTEARSTEAVVPASDDVYEFIIFRGKDILDLHVCEAPPATQPAAPQPPHDPAIVSTQAPAELTMPAPPMEYSQPPPAYQQPVYTQQLSPAQPPQPPHEDDRGRNWRQSARSAVAASVPRDADYHGPGSGGYLNRRKQNAHSSEVPQEEFDFTAANMRFNKDEIAAEMRRQVLDKNRPDQPEGDDVEAAASGDHKSEPTTEEEAAHAKKHEDEEEEARKALEAMTILQPKYDKSKSFFDDISTDMDDSESDRRLRFNRETDTETFGDIASHYKSSHIMRGRGGGAVGGGGGGGYRQGGYQRHDNRQGGFQRHNDRQDGFQRQDDRGSFQRQDDRGGFQRQDAGRRGGRANQGRGADQSGDQRQGDRWRGQREWRDYDYQGDRQSYRGGARGGGGGGSRGGQRPQRDGQYGRRDNRYDNNQPDRGSGGDGNTVWRSGDQ